MNIQPLRDIILIEADGHNLLADKLDECASGDMAPSVVRKRLYVAAIGLRQRAKVLNDVLAASEPKAEAS